MREKHQERRKNKPNPSSARTRERDACGRRTRLRRTEGRAFSTRRTPFEKNTVDIGCFTHGRERKKHTTTMRIRQMCYRDGMCTSEWML